MKVPFWNIPPFQDKFEINQILKASSSSTYPSAFKPQIIMKQAKSKNGVEIRKDWIYLTILFDFGNMISSKSVTGLYFKSP